ncbi:MAG: O-antigen ligase family protein [Psychroserpens sp.]|uniref:O-antigen ligase family protein n=1 Tax=Psychroserpens sp. TaxID=2020870 RepID=UPI0030019128
MIYFYVLLLRIVAYLEGTAKIVSFAGVFVLMLYSIIKRTSVSKIKAVPKYVFYSLLLTIVLLVHGLILSKIEIRDVAVLLTYWIWLVFTFTYFKNKTLDECLKYILISFLIFNFANFVHFKLYFADQKLGLNSILALFGIVDYRIYFPLSSGANVFTSQLGLNALIGLYFIKHVRNNIWYILIYTFYIYMLVLADSRLILLLTLFFSFIYWFSLKTIVSFFKKTWWVIGLVIAALLYLFYNTEFFDGLKRPGELTGKALSRIEIWSIALKTIFSDFSAIYGHGLNGFENSMSDSTKEVFEDQYLQTSHNFILQTLIDFGIIGAIIVLTFIVKIFALTLKLRSLIITILIVMLLLIGFTESIPSFYSTEATLFFITILSILFIQNERKDIRFSTN